VHWRLRILEPLPERWSVLLGDVLTNFRAAMDHTFWAAAVSHSGQPEKPQRVTFPIAMKEKSFKGTAKDLQCLVSPAFWDFVEAIQPFHGSRPHAVPLESLRWLSNVDKHRAVHVVGRVAFDTGPIIVDGAQYEVVEEQRFAGELADKRCGGAPEVQTSSAGWELSLIPHVRVLAFPPGQRRPVELFPLDVVMEALTEDITAVLAQATVILGAEPPDPDSLELGDEHNTVAADYGGVVVTFTAHDGTAHRVTRPLDDHAE
jgi:hypothetical protein